MDGLLLVAPGSTDRVFYAGRSERDVVGYVVTRDMGWSCSMPKTRVNHAFRADGVRLSNQLSRATESCGVRTQAPQITVSEPWGGLDVQSLGGGASNRDIACRIYAEGVSRSRWGERSTVADCLKVGTSLSRRL